MIVDDAVLGRPVLNITQQITHKPVGAKRRCLYRHTIATNLLHAVEKLTLVYIAIEYAEGLLAGIVPVWLQLRVDPIEGFVVFAVIRFKIKEAL